MRHEAKTMSEQVLHHGSPRTDWCFATPVPTKEGHCLLHAAVPQKLVMTMMSMAPSTHIPSAAPGGLVTKIQIVAPQLPLEPAVTCKNVWFKKLSELI